MNIRKSLLVLASTITAISFAKIKAAELHVSPNGNDSNRGTKSAPLRTIQRAAQLAQSGDKVTVHEGVYRERVNPPRGGASEKERIVYQAACGETVEIRGSEIVKNWVKCETGHPESHSAKFAFWRLQSDINLIRGDWFEPKGCPHHTGAVDPNWRVADRGRQT